MRKAPNKHEVDEQEIAKFNLTRENLKGKEFNQAEIREKIHKMLGYSHDTKMLRALCDGVNPPILKIRRGVYCFNPKPVFKDRLQTVWDTYTKFSISKNKCFEESPDQTALIKDAIMLLKNAGYKVLKPITQYEEV